MTKYTDEEIIAYLKTLKVGDTLTAVKDVSDDDITLGERYVILSDVDGDLMFVDDFPYGRFINAGDDYRGDVFDLFKNGVFEIPTQQQKPAEPFYVELTEYSMTYGEPTIEVTVNVDTAGLAKIKALETEGRKSTKLAQLYAELSEVQRKIGELTKEAAK